MVDESRLAVLENKMNYYEAFLEKIDTAIVKMSEASSDISKMLAVHQEKIDTNIKNSEIMFALHENIKTEMQNKIDNLKNYTEHEHNELREEVLKIKNDLIDLNKLKWIVNGIGVASGICITVIVALYQTHLTNPEPSANVEKQELRSK